MKYTPSRTFYILLDTDSMISALTLSTIPPIENGGWGVDIEPGYLVFCDQGLTPENPKRVSLKWVQSGCSYSPDSGYISQFGVEAFFNMDALDHALYSRVM